MQAGSGKKSKRGGVRFSHKKSSTKRALVNADKMDAAPLDADAVRDQDRAGSGEEEEGGDLEAEGGTGDDAGASSSQESHDVAFLISLCSPHGLPLQKRSRSPEAADITMGVEGDGKGADVMAEGEGTAGGEGKAEGEGKAKAADGKPIDTAPTWRPQRPVRARRDKPHRPFDPSDLGPAGRVEVPGSQGRKEDQAISKEDKGKAKDLRTDLVPLHSASPRKGAAFLRAPAHATVHVLKDCVIIATV